MEQIPVTERLLHLSMEIICLLTGETFTAVKSGDFIAITAPSHHFVMHRTTNNKKLLELTNKMIELLTVESDNIRHRTEVKEEVKKEYVVDDGTIGSKTTLTSPDRFKRKYHPEKCLEPLYSPDSAEEGQKIPHYDQGEDQTGMKAEGQEETSMRGEQPITEKIGIMVTVKDEQEQMFVRAGLQSEVEVGRTETIKVEGGFTNVNREHRHRIERRLEEHHSPSPCSKTEDNIIQRENSNIRNVHRSPIPSDPGDSADITPAAIHNTREHFSCSACGTRFSSKVALGKHEEVHKIPDCEKGLLLEENLVHGHSVGGKGFPLNSQLTEHQKSHGGQERERFSCSECGKCFSTKAYRNIHRQNHTGLKPYECSECGKFFARKMYLSRHQVRHLGHKPFECPECGKCFVIKPDLDQHLKLHTGERPFSCSECGKRFTRKSGLHNHRTFHTGEHPFACPECGKCFTRKSEVRRHLKLHTGERPFSCSECGKCFSRKTHLVNHHRVHTGERPFPCSLCGKRFKCKRVLTKHEGAHGLSARDVSETSVNVTGVQERPLVRGNIYIPSVGRVSEMNTN